MNTRTQRGAVSIFIVIFTSLLVTIVTTSFVQIMIQNQQQASNNDLSQSAYDSAMAGVEDAKRALVALKECDKNPSAACNSMRSVLANDGQECEVLGDTRVGVANFDNGEGQPREVKVGVDSMNQAYTCVTVQVVTDSYEGTLDQDESVVIPLLTTEGRTNDITGVRISWFLQKDIPEGLAQLPQYGILPTALPRAGEWQKNQPSMMRSQLIQFRQGSLALDSFSTPDTNNSLTRFLFPASPGPQNQSFELDARLASEGRNSPSPSQCANSFSLNGGYACSVDVAMPAPTGGDPSRSREAYLQLSSLYNKASYKVEMLGAPGETINFDNVQPIVDSTGRASDLFRRVRARVAVSSVPSYYPEAALQLNKSLCKDFFITNNSAHYSGNTGGAACIAE